MTVDVTYIELKNFAKYVCPVDIFGVPCLLTASYNSRKGQRLISLTSYDGDIVYLKPKFITNSDRVFLNFNMLLNELNVYVTLEALTINGVKQTSTDYLNWSRSYRLAFVSLPPTERLEGFRNLSDEETFAEFTWVVTTADYSIEGSYQTARYTGTRIIENEDYNSYADIDLVEHIVRSFHDTSLQTYAAFTTAVGQLIGAVDWVLDLANNQIVYTQPNDPTIISPAHEYYWQANSQQKYTTANDACKAFRDSFIPTYEQGFIHSFYVSNIKQTGADCNVEFGFTGNTWFNTYQIHRIANPDYDPNAEEEYQQETLPLDVVAQKVISNAESNTDEVLQLLSQDYVTIVVNSIFETTPNKRFVTLSDLTTQFELNKVLAQ